MIEHEYKIPVEDAIMRIESLFDLRNDLIEKKRTATDEDEKNKYSFAIAELNTEIKELDDYIEEVQKND